ncbi:hypothetical protein ACFC0S_19665 [Streptomyces sp. NPDC056084]|uniref:hypothetical protein n=1 Tax=unclassified Streptomyces TaxID=2593676 RepID=UPI0035DDBD9F
MDSHIPRRTGVDRLGSWGVVDDDDPCRAVTRRAYPVQRGTILPAFRPAFRPVFRVARASKPGAVKGWSVQGAVRIMERISHAPEFA